MHKVTWLLVQVWKVGGPSRRGLYKQGRGLYKQGRGLYIRGCTWYEKVEGGYKMQTIWQGMAIYVNYM